MKIKSRLNKAVFFIVIAGILFLSGCKNVAIKKGPYLQNVTKDAITICWETDALSRGVVLYQMDASMQAGMKVITEEVPRLFHEIRIKGLSTETLYDYRVNNLVFSDMYGKWINKEGPSATFKTAPEFDTPFRFTVWGDSQETSDIFTQIAALMEEAKPDIAVSVGDLVSNGWVLDQWQTQCFTPAKDFRMVTPTFAAIGNHEAETPYFYKYFSLPGNERFYSFTYGNSRFVVLDTNMFFPLSPLYLWLVDEINSDEFKNAKFRFAFFHQPPYTELWNGSYYDGEQMLRDYLVPVLEASEFDIVFNGHTHAYQHGVWPVNDKHSIHYVITGGGGDSLDTEFHKDWPQIQFKSSEHHFMQVDVNGGELKCSAINIDGEVIDSFQIKAGY